jgi:hypothetical protein
LPRLWRIDLPAWVDRQQRYRPDDLLEIEEDRHTGRGDPRGHTTDEDLLHANRPAVLILDRDDAEHQRDQEEGGGADEVLHRDRAAFPPDVQQQEYRQADHRSLCQHCQQEEHDREQVKPHPAGAFRFVILHDPAEAGEQEKRQRERVLGFRNPGH